MLDHGEDIWTLWQIFLRNTPGLELFSGCFPIWGSLGPLCCSPLSIDLTHRAPSFQLWLLTKIYSYWNLRTTASNFLGPKKSLILTTYREECLRVWKAQNKSPSNPSNYRTQKALFTTWFTPGPLSWLWAQSIAQLTRHILDQDFFLQKEHTIPRWKYTRESNKCKRLNSFVRKLSEW